MKTRNIIYSFAVTLLLSLAALSSAAAAIKSGTDRHLIIVDYSVTDAEAFTSNNEQARTIRLVPGEDPFSTIADAIASDGPYDQVHIVSHGTDGAMSLGGQAIDTATLVNRREQLRTLGAMLPADASLSLYGCSIAATEHGEGFVNELSSMLQRPVAASTNTTGSASLGGDWELEYHSSAMRSAPPFDAAKLETYKDTLSHFRGGSISWQSADLDGDGLRNDVRITVKTAWRASLINTVTSLGSTPALSINQVSENVIFVGGPDSGTADYALQTTILEARNLDPDTPYLVNYSGGNRIGGLQNNSNGYWNIQSTIFMQDNNLAPKIDLPIIFQVPQFQSDGVTPLANWTYDIGSTDPNADKLRYRLANIGELGNSGQSNPAGLSINPNTGLLTWSGSGSRTAGLYSGGIVAEDVDELGNPKSKSHVDFILDLQPSAAVEFSYSSSIPETRNIRVDKGTTYAFSITGAAIETTSLGDVQGALTETTEGNFLFDPGVVGAGLDPGAYPITFEISDTNNTHSNSYLTLNFIVPDPDAPRIDNLEGDRTIYSATVSQLVDEDIDAIVSDADNTHFNNGRLKFNVTFTDGQYEVLDIASTGDGAGEIRVSGDDIFYEGNLIGVKDGTLNGSGRALLINFTTADSTIAAVQALIRSLTYEDTFVLRATGDRALSLFMEDPEGHTSSYDFFIDVQAHPSAPPPGGGPIQAANELTIVEGATVSLSDENLNYADPDAGDTVTLTVSNVTNGQFELVSAAGTPITTFTQEQVTLGEIAFAHDGSELAPSYDVSASDGTNPPTTPAAATINFSNVGDQIPTIGGIPDTTVYASSAYSFTPTASDADVGAGSVLTFSVSNLPSWATFSTVDGLLSGTPANGDIGNYPNIVITVTDDSANSSSLASFSIQVLASPDSDGDGVPDTQEASDGTDPNDPTDYRDTDGDGVPDYVETNSDGTDPNDAGDYTDTDGDGVPDYVEENVYGTDPAAPDAGDTDGDGVPDYNETYTDGTDPNDAGDFADADGDGVPDYTENAAGTDPDDASDYPDADGDGVPDYVEAAEGTDPNDAADYPDSDGDGVPDYVETEEDGTDPNDATDYRDSDGDGVPDYIETEVDGTNPNDDADYRDSDGDGVPDYVETEVDGTDPNNRTDYRDSDGDGVPDYVETQADGTDPDDAGEFVDSDNDGVPDYVEENVYDTDPATADAGDMDGDGVPDYVETYVDGSDPNDAADYADSDGDGVPDYVESNIDDTDPTDATDYLDGDGDGVPDYVESNIDGTDPADSNDFLDSDGDGIPNHTENQRGTDPDDPTSAPVEIATIDATGLYTRVTLQQLVDLGLLDSADQSTCCGDFLRAASDGEPLFAPGRHRISWGEPGVNMLTVRPLISVGPDAIIAEGEIASFTLWLNGPSPTAPLLVPYTVSGSADSSDHDLLAEGSVVFNAGQTQATVTFMVAEDDVDEGIETIIITLDDPDLNLGDRRVQTLQISEGNAPPVVRLNATQAAKSTLTVSQADGVVTVSALVDDPNVGDTHAYTWATSDAGLTDTDGNDATFSFDPALLSVGVYRIDVSVADDGVPAATKTASIRVRVVAAMAELGTGDSDGDGISDIDEGWADSDQDGVPDWQDAYSERNIVQETGAESRLYLIECDAGVNCRVGMRSLAGSSGGAMLAVSDVASLPVDADYDNVGGVFDIEALGNIAGESVRIVVPQRAALPAGASLRTRDAVMGWSDFVLDSGNAVYSAPGEAGVCPPPGDASYASGLNEGDWCVMIVLQDGGANDADQSAVAATGILAGIGAPKAVNFQTTGGSGGGGAASPLLFLLLLFTRVAGGLRRRLGARSLLLALSILALPGIASADSDWWRSLYLNANIGTATTSVSSAELERDFANAGIFAEIASLDKRRGGWGVGIGYPLAKGWSVEVGYQNLNEVDITFTALSTAQNLSQVRPESGKGLILAGAYQYALSETLGLQGRLGLFDWNADYDTYRLDNQQKVGTDSASGTDLFFGVGGYWRALEDVSVDIEYQRFDFDRQPAGYFRVGMRWMFGN